MCGVGAHAARRFARATAPMPRLLRRCRDLSERPIEPRSQASGAWREGREHGVADGSDSFALASGTGLAGSPPFMWCFRSGSAFGANGVLLSGKAGTTRQGECGLGVFVQGDGRRDRARGSPLRGPPGPGKWLEARAARASFANPISWTVLGMGFMDRLSPSP
jgi:hypothetical protein